MRGAVGEGANFFFSSGEEAVAACLCEDVEDVSECVCARVRYLSDVIDGANQG